MIESLFTAGVECAESTVDPAGIALFPGERAQIERAVEKRRREYATVRHCARQALERLGVEPVPILKGEKGAPKWPSGVVGSMTHCDGYRAAAVAYALGTRSVGIDAEPDEPLPDGVLEAVSLPEERAWLSSVAGSAGGAVHWDKLLFCAKESTYKAWFPLTGRWLGFEDAHITFERDGDADGRFHVRLLVPGDTERGSALTTFDGKWLARGGLVMTAITVV